MLPSKPTQPLQAMRSNFGVSQFDFKMQARHGRERIVACYSRKPHVTISEIVALAAVVLSVGTNMALYIHLSAIMNARFDSLISTMDNRFNSVDARFNSVDARFDSIERRLELIQGDLHQMDIRLSKLEG